MRIFAVIAYSAAVALAAVNAVSTGAYHIRDMFVASLYLPRTEDLHG